MKSISRRRMLEATATAALLGPAFETSRALALPADSFPEREGRYVRVRHKKNNRSKRGGNEVGIVGW